MRIKAHYDLDVQERARLEAISAAMIDVFAEAGYTRVALPVLQPADLYLDMAGEDVVKSMFVLEDPAGDELCLRADLTIPLCRRVLDEGARGLPARLACVGSVFRFEEGEVPVPAELIQVGIECLGDERRAGADVEVLGLARAALGVDGVSALEVEIGDLALFPALLADLAMDEVWRRRLAYAFRHPSLLRPTLKELRHGAPTRPLSPSLAGAAASVEAAEHYIRETFGLGNGEPVGSRSLAEIAARLVDKEREARAPRPAAAVLDCVERFLAIEGARADALAALDEIAMPRGGAFAAALDAFKNRLAQIEDDLASGDRLCISTTLGRTFLYYTGFVFDMRRAGEADALAAGGRYDRLMSDLGASAEVPAVGCAIWPERLLAAGGALER